MFEIQLLVVHT